MANKTIHAILQLKDKFSEPISNSQKNTKKFQRQVKKTKNSIKKFKKSAVKDFRSVAKSAVGLAGAYLGFKAIKTGIEETTAAAKAQIEAETKLAAIFKATGKANKDGIEQIKKHASALQDIGVIGDEVTLAFAQQLATYNVTADSVKALSAGSLDLLAQMKGLNATQGDAVNIGNMMGKVLSGQIGALSRAGISFSKAQEEVLKFGTEEEKVATLAKVLEQNVGGVNKALSEMDDGKIKQAKNKWSDYQEVIGKKILPLQAKFAEWFSKHIPKIESFMEKLFIKIQNGAAFLIPKFKAILEWIKKAFDSVYVQDIIKLFKILKVKIAEAFKPKQIKKFLKFLRKIIEKLKKLGKKIYEIVKYFITNWKKFEPLIIGIVGAIVIFAAVILTLKVAMVAWRIVQIALNFAMMANPIGLIFIAIVALIAIGVVLYRNWDKIKAKTLSLWDSFKMFIDNIKEKFPIIGLVIETMVEKWTGVFEGVKTMLSGVISFVTGVFTGDWEKAWQGVQDIFGGIFDGLVAIAKAPINLIIGLFNLLIDKINSLSFNIPDWVPEFGGESFGFSIPKMDKLALGSAYSTKGMYEVNDGTHGGEIVNLPNGSQVIPADRSKEMVKGAGGVNVYVTIQGNVIGNEEFANDVGNKIVKKVKCALNNM